MSRNQTKNSTGTWSGSINNGQGGGGGDEEEMREIDLLGSASRRSPRPSVVATDFDEPREMLLSTLIRESTLSRDNSDEQTAAILAAFNGSVILDNVVSYDQPGGTRILSNQVRVFNFNDEAVLHGPTQKKVTPRTELFGFKSVNPNTKIEQITKQDANLSGELVLNHLGKALVVVKPNHYLKCFLNNKPVLLDEGPHVFTGGQFTPSDQPQVNTNMAYVAWGKTHILTVPLGKKALIQIDGKAFILDGREDPYVFDTNRFQILNKRNQNMTQQFNPESDLVDSNTPHIQNGTLHVLNVPVNCYAKVRINNKPELLKGREEPYTYNTSNFFLDKHTQEDLFVPANETVISYGSHIIVNPNRPNLAILIGKPGETEVIDTNSAKEGKEYHDPRFSYIDTIDTSMRQLIYPEGEEYDHVRTSDGLPIKMKLLIMYKVSDVKKAIGTLKNQSDIRRHVELVADADMKKAVSGLSFADFQSQIASTQTRVRASSSASASVDGVPSAPESITDSIITDIQQHLKTDLEAVGIELKSLAYSEFEVDNPELQNAVQQSAKKTAETASKLSMMEAERKIALAQAEREQQLSRIQQTRETEAATSKAERETSISVAKYRMESETQKIDAQTKLATAETEKKTAEVRAQTQLIEAKGNIAGRKAEYDTEVEKERALSEIKTKAWIDMKKAEGEIFKSNPEAVKVETARAQAQFQTALAMQQQLQLYALYSQQMAGGQNAANSRPFMMFPPIGMQGMLGMGMGVDMPNMGLPGANQSSLFNGGVNPSVNAQGSAQLSNNNNNNNNNK